MCTNFFFNMQSSRMASNRRRYASLHERTYHAVPLETDSIAQELTENVIVNRIPCFGTRHTQMLLLASSSFLMAIFKVYMSVCVVAMTDPAASINKDIPTYNWTDTNLILSSFFWGYCLPQLFAGWLTTTCFGSKWMLISAISSCSCIGFLIPQVAASVGSKGVLVCRFFQGFACGFYGSCVYSFYGKWIPVNERTRFVGFVHAGGTLGIICTMFWSGQIAAGEYGWPFMFYLYGAIGIIWCVMFATFAFESPNQHPYISFEERVLIQENSLSRNDWKIQQIPWRHIFSSSCFWSLVLAQCGESYGYYLPITEMSNYFKNILKMDMKSNGFLSALPYVSASILIYLFGYLADVLINKRICTVGLTRKLLTSLGFIVPGIAFVILGYCGPGDATLAVIMLIVGISVDLAGNMNGMLVNYVDLAPNFSGPLLGISNQFSQPFSALGPLTVHLLVTDESNRSQWRTIFFMAMGFKVLTGAVFLIFGSGEVQSWNEELEPMIPEHENEVEEEEL